MAQASSAEKNVDMSLDTKTEPSAVAPAACRNLRRMIF